MFNNFLPEKSRLFTPHNIKDTVVKNRFMRSAVAVARADPDGFITEDLCNFYKTAAEGGVGLLVTGAISVHPRGKFFDRQTAAYSDEYIPGLKKLADTIHRYGDGVVAWAQLHCGCAQHWEHSYRQRKDGLDVCDLDVCDLQDGDIYFIIDAFGNAALRMKQAGFDGVQLHGAHRYLIAHFLSPATNLRTDKWGGTPEKRMRFVLEVYQKIREKSGDNFPVSIKMNTADYLKGGNWLKDTIIYAKRFSEVGFDLIEMSGGMFFMNELREELRKRAGQKEAYFRDAIPEFREAVGDTALAIVGGIRTPIVIENILGEGVDFISLARPYLAEPNLPNRIKEGDYRPSRCVSTYSPCNLCRAKVASGSVTCVRFFPDGV